MRVHNQLRDLSGRQSGILRDLREAHKLSKLGRAEGPATTRSDNDFKDFQRAGAAGLLCRPSPKGSGRINLAAERDRRTGFQLLWLRPLIILLLISAVSR